MRDGMAEGLSIDPAVSSVFDPRSGDAWLRWRERKLREAPQSASELVVEVRDPRHLTDAEHAALLERCRRANMAIYASGVREDAPDIPKRVGARLGLRSLDVNLLAEDDGVTRIAVNAGRAAAGFIPYTDRRMLWHTDGYYNPPSQRIRAMLLHCVRPAARGGETAVMDHELAWLLLMEADPALVRALMLPDALTIPERRDDEGVARPAVTGPVFSVEEETGDLHMRFTARRRSIEWKRDAAVSEAAARMLAILDNGSSHVLRLRLEAGMGLVCNNVLHERAAFEDDPEAPRLFLRARFHERIAGTERNWAALPR
jgi:alpha-ketoglutarate-dependent taurine dioxygenase